MNSKELLKQADRMIEDVEKIKDIRRGISVITELYEMLNNPITVIDLHQGTFEVRVDVSLRHDEYISLKDTICAKLNEFIDNRIVGLKELLVQPEPIKTPLGTISDAVDKALKREDECISSADKSLDKYPAKKSKKSPYPDNMTPELVRKMYVDEGKTLKQVAEYFELKPSQVNGFLIKHKLFRGSYDKAGKNKPVGNEASKPLPLRARGNTERCRICGKEIQFSAKMTREMWPYKYTRKRDSREQIVYACDREHFYAGKTKDA